MSSLLPKEDLRVLWVAALRSGDYKQATGSLRKPAGDCCLGVLCDIAGILDGGTAKFPSSFGLKMDEWNASSLPVGFRIHMGISLQSQSKLIRNNDKKRMTFAAISDELETGAYYED